MTQKTIAKNTVWMTTASVLQKLVAFAYFAIIARNIGAENTGNYFFAMSFTTIFAVFIDLGLTNVLVREGAKKQEKISDYLSAIFFVKVFSAVLSYLSIILAINLMGYGADVKILVFISGLTMITDSIHLSFYGALRAVGNLSFESVSMFISQLLTMILGTVFIYLKFPLYFLMIAFLIPSFLNVIYSGSIIKFKYKTDFKVVYNKEVLKYFFAISIPFALASIFNRIYSYVDSIILSKLAGAEVVGWYSIPYKISYAFQFIPIALVAAVYPRFSEYFYVNKERLRYIFENAVKYLLLLSFPISIGIFVLAKEIVLNIFTAEYENSIIVLRVLIIGLIFTFVNFLLGAFLNACDKQKTQTTLTGIVMLINIVSNLVLIPKYGALGAAISAVFGNIIITIISFLIVPSVMKLSYKFLIKTFFQITLASVVMGVFVCYTKSVSNFYFAILVGVLIYPVLLFITKTINIRQIKEALRLIKN
ncbi:MAG: flippase [Patescibacteria group bacterium]